MSPTGPLKAQMGPISLVWSHRAAPQSPKTSQGCSGRAGIDPWEPPNPSAAVPSDTNELP